MVPGTFFTTDGKSYDLDGLTGSCTVPGYTIIKKEDRNIFFAVPCKNGLPRIETTGSLMGSADRMLLQGWLWNMRSRVGDSYPHRVRNLLVGMFLDTDCTDMVWIDDDITWDPNDLIRLIKHPVDFVGAAYRVKDDGGVRYPMRLIDNQKRDRDPVTGLMEVDTLPFGFVRITRAGIERMVEQRKHTWFDDMGIRAYDLFDIRLLPQRTGYEGEDYSFCVRWREGGQKVWCDPDIKLGHIGEKGFYGCLGEELKAYENDGLAGKIKRELDAA